MHRKSAYILCLAVFAMLVIGIVMLFSTSAFAKESHNDVSYFVKHQAVWIALGLIACTSAALVDYHFWQRTWWIWFGLAVALLAFCFVPHIGHRINGSRRWIGAGPMTFQPSEMARIAAVFFLAYWFTRYEKESKGILRGFVFPAAVIGVMIVLIAAEVDLGTTALIGATAFVLMFIAGTNPALLGVLAALGVSAIIFIATLMPERMDRLTAFMHPEKYKQEAGLQQMQALIAWGSGGIEGRGLGQGRQKMAYLPYAHTDFIFPMIGEELGLRVSLLVVFLFVL
ncbi:MAG: FtsW/RodA/SpoVE family cell cycle protein, partial [Chthoniobacterales bacterium]